MKMRPKFAVLSWSICPPRRGGNLRLTELMDGESALFQSPSGVALDITGLTSDSREVRPGYLFAALAGSRTDGRGFIADAIARGAVAVLVAAGTTLDPLPVPVIADTNPRRRLALMAARFHAPQPKTIAAVTGTNGKTSVAAFARQIWQRVGRRAASLGTIGIVGPDFWEPGSRTTPDPVALHQALQRLAVKKIGHVAIEASSHGLDQFRLCLLYT